MNIRVQLSKCFSLVNGWRLHLTNFDNLQLGLKKIVNKYLEGSCLVLRNPLKI